MVREFGVPLAAIPGDMPMVTALLDRLATRGSGAARQRRSSPSGVTWPRSWHSWQQKSAGTTASRGRRRQ
jgi:hypothetical protein